MTARSPSLVVIGGPNGAGKTTAAPALLRDLFQVDEFVNADLIAQGISGFDPSAAAMAAGRVMLRRLHDLAQVRASFAFESTLASRSYARWIRQLKQDGHQFALLFLWLPSVEVAIQRVSQRVAAGGHDVPEEIVRRRYERGLANFFGAYRALADRWILFDNSRPSGAEVARGGTGVEERVTDEQTWKRHRTAYERA